MTHLLPSHRPSLPELSLRKSTNLKQGRCRWEARRLRKVLIKNANLLVLHRLNLSPQRREKRAGVLDDPIGIQQFRLNVFRMMYCVYRCPTRRLYPILHPPHTLSLRLFCVNWWCIDFNLFPLLPIHYTTQHLILSVRISIFNLSSSLHHSLALSDESWMGRAGLAAFLLCILITRKNILWATI